MTDAGDRFPERSLQFTPPSLTPAGALLFPCVLVALGTYLAAITRREEGLMPPIFRRIVSISVWLLFLKGLLIMPVTVYTFSLAFLKGEPTPMVGVVSCAAGTLALLSACVAAWIRKALD